MDVFNPPVNVLVKLGSIVVHSEELISPKAHHFDVKALETLLADEEIKEWLAGMQKLALLPVKR